MQKTIFLIPIFTFLLTACAKEHKSVITINTFPIAGSDVEISLVTLPAGSFIMGSEDIEDLGDASPAHEVTLDSFMIGMYEVTQEQYRAVMGVNPSFFQAEEGRGAADGELQARCPVENVTWFNAIEFCNALSLLEGLSPVYTISEAEALPGAEYSILVEADWSANGYRLPTEAEWEWSCRAGTATAWSFGDSGANISQYAWTFDNSGDKTREVGTKRPNAWGLHDMHGNVWEWCWDWFGSYCGERKTNPTGAPAGTMRVMRGGSWLHDAQIARSACRGSVTPLLRVNSVGFRVARNVCPSADKGRQEE